MTDFAETVTYFRLSVYDLYFAARCCSRYYCSTVSLLILFWDGAFTLTQYILCTDFFSATNKNRLTLYPVSLFFILYTDRFVMSRQNILFFVVGVLSCIKIISFCLYKVNTLKASFARQIRWYYSTLFSFLSIVFFIIRQMT